MIEFWRTLLVILFPPGSLGRWMNHVFSCLRLFDAILTDPERREDLLLPECRLKVESLIAQAEDWITFLTNARAAELAGLNYTYVENKGRVAWAPAVPRAWDSLMQRYQRMQLAFLAIERNAKRRAVRLKRAIADASLDHPLRLDAAHQSTSPALRAEEESRLRMFIVRISSSSALHWGRWIATSSSRDGGGCHARGPPHVMPLPIADCRLPQKPRF